MFNVKEISVADLQQLLAERKDEIHLVDVRSPMEIAQGAIVGAVPMPLHTLPFNLEQLPQDKQVIFYCRTGARSAQACAFVMQHGKDNVFNLRGGIVAWAQSGQAVA